MSKNNINPNFSCPIPKFEFDKINMGHGSGGALTYDLLNKGVFSFFKNDFLDKKHDGAILPLEGKAAFTTDSYVVTPIFFRGGNIGDLAINGTVNDLSMCGAIPKYISLSLIIEEGFTITDLWKIFTTIKTCCEKAQVIVVTGDTKVVEKGKGDGIFINTSGIGIMHEQANIALSNIRVGDVVIISGNIGDHGIAILSQRNGLEFETDIKSDSTNLNLTTEKLISQFGNNIHFLRDATRGGLAGILTEVAKDLNVGIDIKQKQIPIGEQVNGACEMLGLDPLYIANEGKFITVVDQRQADEILSFLHNDENGVNAQIIGHITKEHPSKVIIQNSIGGKKILNMLPGEQLPRIC